MYVYIYMDVYIYIYIYVYIYMESSTWSGLFMIIMDYIYYTYGKTTSLSLYGTMLL